MSAKFPIITLCGSMKFVDNIMREAQRLTAQGYIVLAPFIAVPSTMQDADHKEMLDNMHFHKIRMADFVHIVTNADGYAGESTNREMEYCRTVNVNYRIIRYNDRGLIF